MSSNPRAAGSNPAVEIEHQVARLEILANEIRERLTLARRHGQATLSALMDAGDRLLEAKKALDHGQWDDWLSDNFALSDRSARLYMQLAQNRRRIEARMATVAVLGIRGALEVIHEDQIQEGKEKRNRELLELELARRGNSIGPEPTPDHLKVTRDTSPKSPPSELNTAVTAVRLTIERWREWTARFGLLEQFDAELRREIENLTKR